MNYGPNLPHLFEVRQSNNLHAEPPLHWEGHTIAACSGRLLDCPYCGRELVFCPVGFANSGGHYCIYCGVHAYDLKGVRLPSSNPSTSTAEPGE